MAESVVGFLLDQLSTLFQQECARLGGLQQELQYIKDELGSMRAFLREAEAKEDADPNPDSEFQEWVKQVREAAYDTEDVLDEFLLMFPRHQAGGFYGRVQKIYTSMKNLRARGQISTKIKDIKYRIDGISARHQRYRSENCTTREGWSSIVAGEDGQYDIRGHALLLDEADLVGIDKPKCDLISHILDDDSHLKVVSVVGMGGLGKTTLVKRVYEDGTIRRKFSTHAWLTVSQRLHIKELFKSLIRQLYREIQGQVPLEVESMDGNELRAFVKDFLKQKRFIIVLDDVWGTDSWDAVKYALPDGNCGSCVVLTTRIADVASTSCKESRGHVYKMKPLSEQESWTLFCKKTFEDNCCPPFLEEVSRSILGKCDGLPLAIVAICGLLALKDKSSPNEWEMVCRNLGGELEGTGKLDRVKKILLLSYNGLPYYLKICLLYMSIYPEDYRIRVFRLIRLWVAEGFVQGRTGMSIVEVGEAYLNELVNRSLIQVGSANEDELRPCCSIHDLLREIIVSKSKEHNFTTVAIGRHTKWLANARRLAIHDFVVNSQEGFRCKKIRSLVTFGGTNDISSSTISKLLCSGPKLLKVLNVEDAELKNIPKEVFKLFLLKHLNLRGNPIEVIPRSIGKLKNLEFLNLDDTNVKELPIDILKLGKLRELYKKGDYSTTSSVSGFRAPYEIGQLHSLQSLDSIDADNEEVLREIGKLTQLKWLGITKLRSEDGKELCSSLEQLTNLGKLCITSNNEYEILDLHYSMSPAPRFLQMLELEGQLEKLPPWLPSLVGLTDLRFLGSRLMEDPLESLRDLPNLRLLLLNDAYEGGTLHFKAGAFQKLNILGLTKLKRLRWIMAEEGTMPHLKELYLTNCKSMEEMPQGIQNLSKLQTLGFYDMSNELITKLQIHKDQGSDDYKSIAHIPQVVIRNRIDGKWEAYYL